MKMKASHKVITLLINRGKCKNRTLRSSLSFYQIDLNTVLQFKSKGKKKIYRPSQTEKLYESLINRRSHNLNRFRLRRIQKVAWQAIYAMWCWLEFLAKLNGTRWEKEMWQSLGNLQRRSSDWLSEKQVCFKMYL